MLREFPDAVFYAFSDDPHWVESEFKSYYSNITIVNCNADSDSYIDMRLMSLCKHNIIANSTFSWWAAWLNRNPEKIIIAPLNWFADKRDSSDLIPASWVRI